MKFMLSCRQSSATVVVYSNGAPKHGVFEINPPSGIELQQVFSYSGTQWVDPDLPLTYQFAFYDPVNPKNQLVLQTRSERSYGSTQLPAGLADTSFVVSCSLEVFDYFGASNIVLYPVTVSKAPPEVVLQALSELLLTPNTTYLPQNSIATLTATINGQIDCSEKSLATCLHLNRTKCSIISNTCGACLDGYLGSLGPANTPCLNSVDF